MRHLSILALIKVHYNEHASTGLEFSKLRFKFLWKSKYFKVPALFELITYRIVLNVLTHFDSLLDTNFGTENI